MFKVKIHHTHFDNDDQLMDYKSKMFGYYRKDWQDIELVHEGESNYRTWVVDDIRNWIGSNYSWLFDKIANSIF